MIDFQPTTKYLPGAMNECQASILRRWQQAGGLIIPDWRQYNTDECKAISGLIKFGYMSLAAYGGIVLVSRRRGRR